MMCVMLQTGLYLCKSPGVEYLYVAKCIANLHTGIVPPVHLRLSLQVINTELFRNLLGALGAVFVLALVLIANFVAAVYVMLCVILTLVRGVHVDDKIIPLPDITF